MSQAELLIERICTEREKHNGTPAHLTRARLSLKIGVDLSNPQEFKTDPLVENKIRDAAAALGVMV